MMLANYIGAIALIVIGFYAMITKRDIIKIVVGMGIVDYGLNLMIVSIGFNEGGTAPIFTFGELTSGMYFVDPVPQALTLKMCIRDRHRAERVGHTRAAQRRGRLRAAGA